MITWKSHRSPLREHFSSQASMATFLLWTIQSARLRVVRDGSKRARRGPMLAWKSHRPTWRLFYCGQYRARVCALHATAVNGHVEAPC